MSDTIVLIIVSLAFSAFFCGMEIAFVSDRYISTILVGQNVTMVIYGVQMTDFLMPLLSPIGSPVIVGILQTIISTIVILLFGEFVPKMIFRMNPNFFMNLFAVPLLLIYVLLYPVSRLNTFLSHGFMGLFGFKVEEDKEILPGRVDLDYLLQESNSQDPEVEKEVKIFQNALDFSKVKLRDCMVPRNEIVAVGYDDSIQDLTRAFVSSGFSKIVIYKENIDNIIGYVHSLELFKKPRKWQDKIILMPIVPETMAANKLMNSLLSKKKSLAVVVDEFGGTAGIVSFEDIVEEIFGEIEDEHDTQEYVATKSGENEYVLSGRMEIDFVNDKQRNMSQSRD